MSSWPVGSTRIGVGPAVMAACTVGTSSWNRTTPGWEMVFWLGAMRRGNGRLLAEPRWGSSGSARCRGGVAAPMAAAEKDDGPWLLIYFTLPMLPSLVLLSAKAGAWTRDRLRDARS
jgi:hypothetical protein